MISARVDFKQLQKAVDWSIRQLATPRSNRIDALKQFVGNHYSDRGTDRRVPVNFLELAVTIYGQQLAARAPKALITTHVQELKPYAYTTELAINQVPDEIGLGKTLREAVTAALFSFGVVKVGICNSGVSILGHDVGEPFADLVSVDDYFCDMSAKSRKEMQFEGNDYRIPVQDAIAMWGGDIQPDEDTVTGDQGEDRAEGITKDEGADLYREKVWCRDVWLRRENQIVTYGVKTNKVFNVVDYDGPEGSPYKVLGFSDVPDSLLPLPPVALWLDLHELSNKLFRKLGRQADAKKTVAVFAGGDDEAVECLKRASDGDGIAANGAKHENITVGGIDQATLAMFLQTKDLFAYFGGNLDALGGLAPMSDTIGQDEMMVQGAGARMDFMRNQTLDFTRDVFKALAWYEWTDPIRERVVEKTVTGTNISVKSKWSDETREGNWLDYNFDIDAYSMQSDSPTVKLQKLGQILEKYYGPYLEMMGQQGGQLNFAKMTELIARLANVPELNDIVTFDAPPTTPPEQGSSQPSRMPSHTTRTYERVNRPGASRHGKDDVMARVLMGSGVQKTEAASLNRGVA